MKEKITTKVTYVEECSECGKEFAIDKGSKNTTCYDCKTAQARERATTAAGWLIGATIVTVEPFGYGIYVDEYEFEAIKLRTVAGKQVILTVGGYSEHYIEVNEADEQDTTS